MKYSLKEKQQVRDDLNLDSLPDDEFMELVAAANAAAVTPRPAGSAAQATTPAELEATVQKGTAGELLARAKKTAGRSFADIATALGVSRQRVAEILESPNIELQTMVRVAAAMGYETRVSLHPVDESRPDLTAVLPTAVVAHHR